MLIKIKENLRINESWIYSLKKQKILGHGKELKRWTCSRKLQNTKTNFLQICLSIWYKS